MLGNCIFQAGSNFIYSCFYAHTKVSQNSARYIIYSIARVQFIYFYPSTVICQFYCNCTFPSPCSENTYETVELKESAALSDHVAMETNPAYASVH